MFFVAVMALVVLLYLFGFKVIYFAVGGLVAFYAAAVLSASRTPSSPKKRSESFL